MRQVYTQSKRAIRRRLLRALQPCREMVPLMSESLDRRLGVREHLELKLHLMVCAWCARYLEQIKFLRQLVRQRTFESPIALPAEARERICKSLNDLESRGETTASHQQTL